MGTTFATSSPRLCWCLCHLVTVAPISPLPAEVRRSSSMIRRIVGRLCRRAVEKRASRPDASHLARSAVVFSPHYDDETLGVGGTVIRKRDCGAIVYLVFMTDG